MADLDFIDQIVDKCLGDRDNPTPQMSRPATARTAQQPQQQQPMQQQQYSPAPQQQRQMQPVTSPLPVAPQQQQQYQQPQQQQPQRQYQQQQMQPSQSQQMPSPVPRDYGNERSMTGANGYNNHPPQQQMQQQQQGYPNSARYSTHNGNDANDYTNTNNYQQQQQLSQRGGSPSAGGGGAPSPYRHGGGYTSGGGKPEEYKGSGEPQQFFGGNGGGGATLAGGGGISGNHAGDAALRRIQMWEEKKRLKQAMAKHEQLMKGHEECTFRPDIQGARDSVVAHKLGLTSPKGGGKGTVGFGYGGGNTGLSVSQARGNTNGQSSSPNDGHNTQRSLINASHSMMTPSRLYKDNKAWGFDSFVDRQLYAREMKRQAEADAEAVFALKNPDGRRGITVPEPFEFGNKGRKTVKKALESPATAIAQRVKREQPDFYDEDSSTYDLHHSSSGAYFNDSTYETRQYRATDELTAPSVPAGLFSLHASNMMMEHASAPRGGATRGQQRQ